VDRKIYYINQSDEARARFQIVRYVRCRGITLNCLTHICLVSEIGSHILG
jgi:hypothetical protein